MGLQRLRLGSLLVVALALAGATMVPSRDAARSRASISWQADDSRQAPIAAREQHRQLLSNPRGTATSTTVTQRASAGPVRHPLCQRPPPYAPAT